MAQCVLLDVPNAAIKAILHHVDTHGYASLRLVSQALRKRVTEHVPHITLHLCASCCWDQLQCWCQATSQLQHVSTVHIHLVGEVPAEVFNWAMQLLSQRTTKVKELHLMAAAVNMHSDNAHIWWPTSATMAGLVTLQPLQHLLASLQQLTIKDTVVRNLAHDLRQLAALAAAIGGWQLEVLSLSAQWRFRDPREGCSTFSAGLLNLTQAFPRLTRLLLSVPVTEFEWRAAYVCCPPSDDEDGFEYYLEGARSIGIEHHGDDDDDDASEEPVSPGHRDDLRNIQLAEFTCVTSIVNAMTQLKHLEMLIVSGLPDIWKPRLFSETSTGEPITACYSAVAAAAYADDAGFGRLIPGPLQSISAAAKALKTLDNCGCWLLHHHPTLTQLEMRVANERIGMSWRQDRRQLPSCSTSNSIDHCKEAAISHSLQSVHLVWRVPHWRYIRDMSESLAADISSTGVHRHSSTSLSISSLSLDERLGYFLSHYSSRPVSLLTRHINICDLCLDYCDLDNLQCAGLLSDMKSLTVLEVRVISAPCLNCRHDALLILVAAAASMQSLNSLTIRVPEDGQWLTDDVLWPLTAAAGGPGNKLRRLVLIGKLTASAPTAGTAAAASTMTRMCSDAAAVSGRSGNATLHFAHHDHSAQITRWHHALPQFSKLHELVIHQQARFNNRLELPVHCLPASLMLLTCSGLNIISHGHAASSTTVASVDGAACRQPSSAADATYGNSTAADHNDFKLQKLTLIRCQLSEPSILASGQLEQLFVVDSNWSGGWTAAAEAWPNVRCLAWKHSGSVCQFGQACICSSSNAGDTHTSASGVSQSRLDVSTPAQHAQEMVLGFKSLSNLTLDDPICSQWWSRETLQHIAQHLQFIKQLCLHGNRYIVSDADCKALQQWLQQQLPCSSVHILWSS